MPWKWSNRVELTDGLRVIGRGLFAEEIRYQIRAAQNGAPLYRTTVPPPGLELVDLAKPQDVTMWAAQVGSPFGVRLVSWSKGTALVADLPKQELLPDVVY